MSAFTRTARAHGRDDRATSEQVMDPRTRLILFKLIQSGIIGEMHGCVSTGKEANVYHATLPCASRDRKAKGLAVKVYKTSILVFRDRDRYVTGEHRFRHGYCKSNPRKMVKLWAEKEMRNLKRLRAAGVRCPEPLLLRSHVLVMQFLGKDGWPSPRLKDAAIKPGKLQDCYFQCVKLMRTMFQKCKLVHGDLSEYNMLYHRNKIFVIDVSQSVEHGHPRAREFLLQDCRAVSSFFRRKGRNVGIYVMTPLELWGFIVDDGIGDGDRVDSYLVQLMAGAEMVPGENRQMEEGGNVANEVARVDCDRLMPIAPIVRSAELSSNGGGDRHAVRVAAAAPPIMPPRVQLDNDASSQQEGHVRQFTCKLSSKAERKAHKKEVKRLKSDKRKTKVPKHVKKRKQKGGKRK